MPTYCLDFEAIKTIEDVALILKQFNLEFNDNNAPLPTDIVTLVDKGLLKIKVIPPNSNNPILN